MKRVKWNITLTALALIVILWSGCKENVSTPAGTTTVKNADTAEFYLFRPELEKMYGYSHAVKIGNHIKISGAVSMDSAGNLLAPGNLEQQMKNCYSDLEKILAHYGCTFDDVVVENIFTTNMQEFIKVCGHRASLYKKHFPAGDWIGVKELALVGQLIEIDLEAIKH